MSKIINTALCSYGMSGWVFHAPFINAHKGFNLYGVFERTKNLAQEKYPSTKIFRTLEEMLADEKIDLVIVNTPSITHFDFAKKALLANKHVIVEKPFTATVAEAEELIALAKEKNKLLSVFHNRRWDSDFLTVKKILNQNLLGDIKEAEIHYDRFSPELSYKVHKETPTPAVGVVYDLGSHLIDAALQLFGMPNAVFADIMTMRENSLVDDYCEILFYYTTNRVRIKASMFAKEPQGFIVHGTKGSFVKSRSDIQEAQLQQHKNPLDADYGIEEEAEFGILNIENNGIFTKNRIASEPGNYRYFYEGIYEALTNNKDLPVIASQARDVIKIIETVYQSNKEKKVISL